MHILCHVLVAACCLLSSVDCGVQTTAAGGVSWEVAQEQAAAAPKGKKKKQKLSVKVPKWCGKWVVGMDDFKEGVVGAKSKNIAGAATREGGFAAAYTVMMCLKRHCTAVSAAHSWTKSPT